MPQKWVNKPWVVDPDAGGWTGVTVSNSLDQQMLKWCMWASFQLLVCAWRKSKEQVIETQACRYWLQNCVMVVGLLILGYQINQITAKPGTLRWGQTVFPVPTRHGRSEAHYWRVRGKPKPNSPLERPARRSWSLSAVNGWQSESCHVLAHRASKGAIRTWVASKLPWKRFD